MSQKGEGLEVVGPSLMQNLRWAEGASFNGGSASWRKKLGAMGQAGKRR